MPIEFWILLHELAEFVRWAWKFAPSPGILALLFVAGLFFAALFPLIGEEPVEVEDDPVLPERK